MFRPGALYGASEYNKTEGGDRLTCFCCRRDVTEDAVSISQQYLGHVLGTISIVGNKAGTHAVTSSLDCQLRLLNLSTGAVEKTIDAGPGELWQVAYSPDETKLVSGSQQGKINFFDIETEKIAQEISTQAKFVLSVAYVRVLLLYCLKKCADVLVCFWFSKSPDGKHVACGGFDGFVGVYDVETGSLVHKYEGMMKFQLAVLLC
ncbi:unnamed protein product [Phytophthora fragariaefolia]|uniref:Unnamed protein product n=1 Tax=Phytophthora fragariaefolia TaxID=1490495 RepID=A0A9W7CXN5_9STRA|nr:unnamed protein product [Phytophthora fragariaefolia]